MIAKGKRQREHAEEQDQRGRKEIGDPVGREIIERRRDKQRRHNDHKRNRHAHLRTFLDALKKRPAAFGGGRRFPKSSL
jgi:hypothetical protein